VASREEAGGDDVEVLYGRAGWLAAARALHEAGLAPAGDARWRRVVRATLRELEGRAREVDGLPMAWEWEGKTYLGAAHGAVGILGEMLASPFREPRGDARLTAVLLAVLEYAEGELPSSTGAGGKTLVQWCHGAAVAMVVLRRVHEATGDARWLREMTRLEDVVWERGLLTKGPGLCHGVAGNAYALLSAGACAGGDAEAMRRLFRAMVFAGFVVGDGMAE